MISLKFSPEIAVFDNEAIYCGNCGSAEAGLRFWIKFKNPRGGCTSIFGWGLIFYGCGFIFAWGLVVCFMGFSGTGLLCAFHTLLSVLVSTRPFFTGLFSKIIKVP